MTSSTAVLASAFPPELLGTGIVVVSLALAVVLAVYAWRDRSVPTWALGLALLLELALVAMTAIAVVAWIGGDAPAEAVVFLFYLLACLAIPPAMVWWARGEPGRWGSGVTALACAVLAVLVLRVAQVWTGGPSL